jgi:hypothetical protein
MQEMAAVKRYMFFSASAEPKNGINAALIAPDRFNCLLYIY